ncbi:hypothetical protein H6G96_10960 [Nostoc sp. FACHB-892]|uniref:hypothetical protein n=1 Tax=Nostoc sp. FACHB-892 TaxID=2692843 RepID=UPI001682525C|nr:hypothetical protein [Nostoc sp. FACHB-892]MBD2726835.1 hypothetical protein [Nostoc sp. FACHB-892]
MSDGAVSPTVGDRICLKNCKTVDSSSVCRQILLFVEDVRSSLHKITSTYANANNCMTCIMDMPWFS